MSVFIWRGQLMLAGLFSGGGLLGSATVAAQMTMSGMAAPAAAPAPASTAAAPTASPVKPAAATLPPNDHIAPPAPVGAPAAMADGMAGMAMGDSPWLGMLLANELEWIGSPQGPQAAWDVEGWLGTPTSRLWLESEGSSSAHDGSTARTELGWSQAMGRFWDWRLGYRQDLGAGPGRGWLAGGVHGITPYWFELEAMGYVSADGRTALRLEGRYDLLLTQRLILSPKLEAEVYGRSDPRRQVGAGLSDVSLGWRLRYEFSRQFAPYLGVGWDQRFGTTADLGRGQGQASGGLEWMIGLRLWF